MRRRNFPDGLAIRNIFKVHLIFVSVLILGSFIRISIVGTDGNTTIFATILAFGVIIGLSLLNKIVVDLCNDLNDRWTIVNYCIPAILFGLLLFAFRVPVELFDVLFAAGLILAANLLMYSIIRTSKQTDSHNTAE